MLSIEPNGLFSVAIEPVRPDRQMRALDAHHAALWEKGSHQPTATAAFRGLNGTDIGLVARWQRSGSDLDDALIGRFGARNSFDVVTIDRLDEFDHSVLDPNGSLFHFINIFQVAPNKRQEMIDYFNSTIRTVRKQPGYVATNFMMSRDGLQALNIGIYETRETFMAIFRQPEVLRDFAGGAVSGILPKRFGFLPQLPRLKLYELTSSRSQDATTVSSAPD